MKNVVIFLIGVLGMGLVTGLTYNRLPHPIAWSLGFYAMVLIGYPLQRTYSARPVSFARWAILWAVCAGGIGIPMVILAQQVLQ
jgi:hypothetical protein